MTASQAGLIASANYLGYLLGALFAALLRRCPVRGGAGCSSALATSALCTAGVALTSSLPLMLMFAAGEKSGFAGAVAIVMAIALVVERLADTGPGATSGSIHFAGVGVGIIVSALIVAGLRLAGPAVAVQCGFARAPHRCVVLALVAATDPLIPTAHALPGSANDMGRTRRSLSAQFRWLIAANTLSAFGYVITATFIVALVRGSPQLKNLEASIWVVFGLAAAPSVALWLWVARRIDVFRAFALFCLVEAAGVLSSVLWLDVIGTLVAAVCVGARSWVSPRSACSPRAD